MAPAHGERGGWDGRMVFVTALYLRRDPSRASGRDVHSRDVPVVNAVVGWD